MKQENKDMVQVRRQRGILLFGALACMLIVLGCSANGSISTSPAPEAIGIAHAAPKGVVRYCWEEPIAAEDEVSPGLDDRGHWYYPAHTQIHQVRMGRWRPCK